MKSTGLSGQEARLNYTLSGYRVIRPGAYVVCAVTGLRIPLPALLYWSHERQEPYANAAAAAQRAAGTGES